MLFLKLKACVRYFLTNFYFSPNDSPSKTMKDVFSFQLKSSFCSRDIYFFVFPPSPLFLPVSYCFRAWSKINMQANPWHHKLFHIHLFFWIWEVWKGRGKITTKIWISRERKELLKITKIWISQEWKELFRWNKKHFSQFLKGYNLVKI